MTSPGIPAELAAIFAEEAAELLDRLEQATVGLADAVPGGHGAVVVRMQRDLHTLKGSAGAVGLTTAADDCHALEDLLNPHRQGEPLPEDRLTSLLGSLAGLRRTCLGASVEPPPESRRPASSDRPPPAPEAPPQAPSPPPAARDTIRVAVDKLDTLHSSLGELVVARLQSAGLGRDAVALRGDVASLQGSFRDLSATLRALRGQLPARAWRDLEGRLAGFGQQLRRVDRQGANLARRATTQAGHVSVVSDALEGGIQQVRMLPLRPFLQGFSVAVSEAARRRGVKASLAIEDRGIEADRAVVEGLRAPLLHLLRNAVAHGIEEPAERLRRGKPEAGAIRLEASLEGDRLVVVVGDDGAGVDRRRVAGRAADLGLAAADEELGDDDLLRVLCEGGFSTEAAIDGVAGRGIGLDVVADAVHALRGTLSLTSEDGVGARFRLRVPASVASTQGLVVSVGPYRFGVPLDSVRRVIRADRSTFGALEGSAVLYVDGDPLTVTSLADLVGALEHAPPSDRSHPPALVLEVGSSRLAVIVDDVPAELPMVVRSLGRQFAHVGWLAGAAVEADGAVLPVIDPRGLLALARSRRRTVARRGPGPESPTPAAALPAARRILVVDDSVTMRTLQRNILESAGYDVVVAADGMEARDALRTDAAVDLLVTDVDMPRMSGLELCRWVRSGPRADLPVIVVTSLDSDQERRAGLQAGADAYVVKGNFEQSHYLATVRRLVG